MSTAAHPAVQAEQASKQRPRREINLLQQSLILQIQCAPQPAKSYCLPLSAASIRQGSMLVPLRHGFAWG